MTSIVRQLVSKKKKRFKENGFDLDLSYITDRIIAMGFPSEGKEGLYRNPMSEVARFLMHYHANHFKVINLCAEQDYDPNKLGGNVERIPVGDHQIAPLHFILRFCRIADEWLSQDEDNVLVVQCKAGKGRVGMMICSYLLYISYCPNLQTALQFFAEKRTKNGKGVTLPSQRRYISYFHSYIEKGPTPEMEVQLAQISFTANVVSSKDVNVTISTITGRDDFKITKVLSTTDSETKVSMSKCGRTMVLGFSSLWICGDVRFEFQIVEARLFYFWFNTSYIEETELSFWNKLELDRPSKHMELDTQVSLFFIGRRPKEE